MRTLKQASRKKRVDDPDLKLKNAIRSALRKLWMFYSPARKKAADDAKIDMRQINRLMGLPKPSGKVASVFWVCEMCKKRCRSWEYNIDHVEPVGVLRLQNLTEWFEALFYSKQRVLCKDCHSIKTKTDNAEIRKGKRNVSKTGRDGATAEGGSDTGIGVGETTTDE